MRIAAPIILAAWVLAGQTGPDPKSKHVVVYREAGRFGGWPANHGVWSWGDEILVGLEAGYFRNNERGHAIDYSRPAEHVLARSKDGGETWTIERPEALRPPASVKIAGVPTGVGGKEPVECAGGLDFKNPDFILTARMADIHVGPSRFYYSTDRGRSWSGPCKLPDFGQKGIAARTDYIVNGKHDLTMFLTAAKSDGKEGRVIAVRTVDGGKSWKMLAFVGPEPDGSDFAIMPSSVRLPNKSIVTAIRHRRFIDLYRSDDDAKTWKFVTKPVPNTGRGNPPSLIALKDGRLALTYGFRDVPYGIRARISKDEGATWSEEIMLRTDGGNWDLGYPRSVQRSDGSVVTVYYFNDAEDKERYIAATIWKP
jgi:hypothetical protein